MLNYILIIFFIKFNLKELSKFKKLKILNGMGHSDNYIEANPGGEGRDSSGSTSLNHAGSRLDRTGAPERPKPGSLE